MGLSIILPTGGSGSGLEWPAVEGDSPVHVTPGEELSPEYHDLVWSWEVGRHQLPKLNTSLDR